MLASSPTLLVSSASPLPRTSFAPASAAMSQTVYDALAVLLGGAAKRLYGAAPLRAFASELARCRSARLVAVALGWGSASSSSSVAPGSRGVEVMPARAGLQPRREGAAHRLIAVDAEPVDVRTVHRSKQHDERARHDQDDQSLPRGAGAGMVSRSLGWRTSGGGKTRHVKTPSLVLLLLDRVPVPRPSRSRDSSHTPRTRRTRVSGRVTQERKAHAAVTMGSPGVLGNLSCERRDDARAKCLPSTARVLFNLTSLPSTNSSPVPPTQP